MGNCCSVVAGERSAIGGSSSTGNPAGGNDAIDHFLKSHGYHSLFSQIKLTRETSRIEVMWSQALYLLILIVTEAIFMLIPLGEFVVLLVTGVKYPPKTFGIIPSIMVVIYLIMCLLFAYIVCWILFRHDIPRFIALRRKAQKVHNNQDEDETPSFATDSV